MELAQYECAQAEAALTEAAQGSLEAGRGRAAGLLRRAIEAKVAEALQLRSRKRYLQDKASQGAGPGSDATGSLGPWAQGGPASPATEPTLPAEPTPASHDAAAPLSQTPEAASSDAAGAAAAPAEPSATNPSDPAPPAGAEQSGAQELITAAPSVTDFHEHVHEAGSVDCPVCLRSVSEILVRMTVCLHCLFALCVNAMVCCDHASPLITGLHVRVRAGLPMRALAVHAMHRAALEASRPNLPDVSAALLGQQCLPRVDRAVLH